MAGKMVRVAIRNLKYEMLNLQSSLSVIRFCCASVSVAGIEKESTSFFFFFLREYVEESNVNACV